MSHHLSCTANRACLKWSEASGCNLRGWLTYVAAELAVDLSLYKLLYSLLHWPSLQMACIHPVEIGLK
jgi:hypothetical protein